MMIILAIPIRAMTMSSQKMSHHYTNLLVISSLNFCENKRRKGKICESKRPMNKKTQNNKISKEKSREKKKKTNLQILMMIQLIES